MARNIDQIQAQIISSIQADPVLSGASSPSKRAHWNLWARIMATAQNTEEQLNDAFITEVEAIAATASAGSFPWLQYKIFQFQYNATTPQVIQVTNGVAAYPVINPLYQIITRCSVTQGVFNTVNIKVAKGSTPQALASSELSALQSYLNPPNGIGVGGINYNVSSTNPDQLYCAADIYYNGMYAAVILANITTAFNNYLALISSQPNFGGIMKLSDLEQTLRNVAGVNDVALKNVSARADSTAWGSGTSLVSNYLEISPTWQMQAGYMIGETTTGQTLANSLNLIPQ